MEPLKFERLKIGMKVIDNDKNIGTITEIEDIHNVFVEYDNGGFGCHCFVEGCLDNLVPYYDPLFEYKKNK